MNARAGPAGNLTKFCLEPLSPRKGGRRDGREGLGSEGSPRRGATPGPSFLPPAAYLGVDSGATKPNGIGAEAFVMRPRSGSEPMLISEETANEEAGRRRQPERPRQAGPRRLRRPGGRLDAGRQPAVG